MDKKDIKAVMDSYRRVRNKGFAEHFYEIFLDADPRFRPMFKHTDFSRQRELLLHSIFVLLEYADGSATGKMAVKRLGEMHSKKKMNISADMYSVWTDTLVRTIRELDPESTPVLEKNWREAVQKGIDLMIELA